MAEFEVQPIRFRVVEGTGPDAPDAKDGDGHLYDFDNREDADNIVAELGADKYSVVEYR